MTAQKWLEATYADRTRTRCNVIFKQFYLSCLAHASYVIGDQETGTAAVVDPQRDTDQYLAFVAEHALQIKHVFLTHLHADFIAWHLELRDRVGATIYLGRSAKAANPFTPVGDGDALEFGRVRLKMMEAPATLRSRSPFSFTISTPAPSNRTLCSPETPCLSAT